MNLISPPKSPFKAGSWLLPGEGDWDAQPCGCGGCGPAYSEEVCWKIHGFFEVQNVFLNSNIFPFLDLAYIEPPKQIDLSNDHLKLDLTLRQVVAFFDSKDFPPDKVIMDQDANGVLAYVRFATEPEELWQGVVVPLCLNSVHLMSQVWNFKNIYAKETKNTTIFHANQKIKIFAKNCVSPAIFASVRVKLFQSGFFLAN